MSLSMMPLSTNISIFVIRCAAITEYLVNDNEMPPMQRVRCCDKAFEDCTKQKWRLSSHDHYGTQDPDFDMLKKFILEKTEIAKRNVVYYNESAIEGISVNPTAQQPRLNPQLVRLRDRLLNLLLLLLRRCKPGSRSRSDG